jgi:hypothetical protein
MGMRLFVTVMILACALYTQAPAQTGVGLLQPDAAFVIGIEWRKIVNSSVGGELTDQIKKSKPPLPGMDALEDALLHDLDSITIAARASALGKANSRPPVLVVVKGHFRADQFQGLDQLKAGGTDTYRSVEMIVLPDDTPASTAGSAPASAPKTMRLAVLDMSTVLLGDGAEVRGAIDRVKTGRLTTARAGALAGVAELAAKNDLWMIFDLPANALKDAPPAAAQMFAAVKGAELGMSFEEGFGLLLNIRTKDADSATAMAQSLQGLIAMGAMSQTQSPQAAELARKIRIAPESSRVRMSLNIDKAEVQKMIEEVKANAAKAPAVATAAHSARATEPAGPKTVRITGLENGPVEVPLQPKK